MKGAENFLFSCIAFGGADPSSEEEWTNLITQSTVADMRKNTFTYIRRIVPSMQDRQRIDTKQHLGDVMQNGSLITICSRPGVGKTETAINLVVDASFTSPDPVTSVLFSLEMSVIQLAARLFPNTDGEELETVANGLRDRDAEDKALEAPVIIDDTAGLSVLELTGKCDKLLSEMVPEMPPIGLIVIDYVQLMRSNDGKQDMAVIANGLKSLAVDLDVPIVAMSWLNRTADTRPNKCPTLEDLDSALADASDTVVLLTPDPILTKP